MAAGECTGGWPPVTRGAGTLDAAVAMTDNFRSPRAGGRSPWRHRASRRRRKSLDRLRLEVEELRASRKRLVLAADADRRSIERDLHDGVQQHLVALAVNLQLAARAGGRRSRGGEGAPRGDGARRAAGAGRDGAARAADLPAAARGGRPRRGAALGRGERRRPRLASRSPRARRYPPEIAATVYLCWLEALERAGAGARATIDGARRGGSGSPSRSSTDGDRLATRISTGCATASRRSAAG